MRNAKVTWNDGCDRLISVYEYNGCGPVPDALSESSVVSAGSWNRIRQDLGIIRRMCGERSLPANDFSLTWDANLKEYRLWVRNWCGGSGSRAGYYAGMILAYRKLTRRLKTSA